MDRAAIGTNLTHSESHAETQDAPEEPGELHATGQGATAGLEDTADELTMHYHVCGEVPCSTGNPCDVLLAFRAAQDAIAQGPELVVTRPERWAREAVQHAFSATKRYIVGNIMGFVATTFHTEWVHDVVQRSTAMLDVTMAQVAHELENATKGLTTPATSPAPGVFRADGIMPRDIKGIPIVGWVRMDDDYACVVSETTHATLPAEFGLRVLTYLSAAHALWLSFDKRVHMPSEATLAPVTGFSVAVLLSIQKLPAQEVPLIHLARYAHVLLSSLGVHRAIATVRITDITNADKAWAITYLRRAAPITTAVLFKKPSLPHVFVAYLWTLTPFVGTGLRDDTLVTLAHFAGHTFCALFGFAPFWVSGVALAEYIIRWVVHKFCEKFRRVRDVCADIDTWASMIILRAQAQGVTHSLDSNALGAVGGVTRSADRLAAALENATEVARNLFGSATDKSIQLAAVAHRVLVCAILTRNQETWTEIMLLWSIVAPDLYALVRGVLPAITAAAKAAIAPKSTTVAKPSDVDEDTASAASTPATAQPHEQRQGGQAYAGGSDEQPDGSSISSFFGSIVSAVCSIFKFDFDLASVIAYASKFNIACSAAMNVMKLGGWVSDCVIAALDYVVCDVFGLDPMFDPTTRRKILRDYKQARMSFVWAIGARKFEQADKDEIQMRQLCDEYCRRAGLSDKTAVYMTNDVRRLCDTRKAMQATPALRVRPVVLTLLGEPGQRKNTSITSIVAMVAARLGIHDVSKHLYTYNASDEFMEGYNGQMAFVIDDYGASGDTDVRRAEIAAVQHACGETPFPVKMAFEGKGKSFFVSPLIIVSTNAHKLVASGLINNIEAYARRFGATKDDGALSFEVVLPNGATFPDFYTTRPNGNAEYPPFDKTRKDSINLFQVVEALEEQMKACAKVFETLHVQREIMLNVATDPVAWQAAVATGSIPDALPPDESEIKDVQGSGNWWKWVLAVTGLTGGAYLAYRHIVRDASAEGNYPSGHIISRRTLRTPAIRGVKMPKKAVSQGPAFAQSDELADDIATKVLANLGRVYCNTTSGTVCAFATGRYIITVWHYVRVQLDNHDGAAFTARFHNREIQLDPLRLVHVEGCDLCVFALHKNEALFKDLSKHFAPFDALTTTIPSAFFIRRDRALNPRVDHTGVIKINERGWDYKGQLQEDIIIDTSFHVSGVDTANGDCAGVYMFDHVPRAMQGYQGQRIFGFHVAGGGSGNAKCIGSLFTREMYDSAVGALSEAQANGIEPVPFDGAVLVPPGERVHIADRTKIIPTPMFDALDAEGLIVKYPARLRPFVDESTGETKSPLYIAAQRAFSGRDADVKMWPIEALQTIAAEVALQYEACDELLDDHRNLNGDPSDQFITAFQRDTSMGYPHMIAHTDGKAMMMDRVRGIDGRDCWVLSEQGRAEIARFQTMLDYMMEHCCADDGYIDWDRVPDECRIDVVGVLKDECLPAEKVAVGRTRMIWVHPAGLIYLSRRHLMKFNVKHRKDYNFVDDKLGFDAHSAVDCSMLAQYLHVDEPGWRSWSADVGNMDGAQNKLTFALHNECSKAVHTPVQNALHMWSYHSRRRIGPYAVNCNHQHNTGDPNCTEGNSLLMRGVRVSTFALWQCKTPERIADCVDFRPFRTGTTGVEVGDDNVHSVIEPFFAAGLDALFTQKVFAMFGWKYTHSQKNKDLTPSFELDELTFLQRNFVRTPGGWRMPLPLSTIWNMLAWQSKTITAAQAVPALCVAAQLELFLHCDTATQFSSLRAKLRSFAQPTGHAWKPLNWGQLIERRHATGRATALFDGDQFDEWEIVPATAQMEQPDSVVTRVEGMTTQQDRAVVPAVRPPKHAPFADLGILDAHFPEQTLSRFYHVATWTVSSSAAVDALVGYLAFPDALFVEPKIIAALTAYSYLRADVEIRVKVTASPLQTGLVLCAVLPNQTYSQPSGSHCVAMSISEHLFVDLGETGSDYSIVLPWDCPSNALLINNFPAGMIGAFLARVLVAPISSSTEPGPDPTIQIYARFTNIRVTAPTLGPASVLAVAQGLGDEDAGTVAPEFVHMATRSAGDDDESYETASDRLWAGKKPHTTMTGAPSAARPPADDPWWTSAEGRRYVGARANTAGSMAVAAQSRRAQTDEANKANTTITPSAGLMGASAIAGGLAVIPPLAPFAGVVSLLAGFAGGIAKLFGHDNPVLTVAGQPVIDNHFRGFALASGGVLAEPTSLGMPAFTDSGPNTLRDQGAMMQFGNLLTRKTIISINRFSAALTQDEVAAMHWVGPSYCQVHGSAWTSGAVVRMSPLARVGTFFALYSGSMEYELRIVCPKLMAGKIRVSYLPVGAAGVTDTSIGDGNIWSTIIDVQTDKVIKFTVPFLSRLPFKTVGPPTDSLAGAPCTAGGMFAHGYIMLSIVGTLVPPNSTSADVWYVLSSGAGPDFQFHTPQDPQVAGLYWPGGLKVVPKKSGRKPLTIKAKAQGVDELSTLAAPTHGKGGAPLMPVARFVTAGIADPDIILSLKQMLSRLDVDVATTNPSWYAYETGTDVYATGECLLSSRMMNVFATWFRGWRGSFVQRFDVVDTTATREAWGPNTKYAAMWSRGTVSLGPYYAAYGPWKNDGWTGTAKHDETNMSLQVHVPWRSAWRYQTMDEYAGFGVRASASIDVTLVEPWFYSVFSQGGVPPGATYINGFSAAADDFALTGLVYGGDMNYDGGPPSLSYYYTACNDYVGSPLRKR